MKQSTDRTGKNISMLTLGYSMDKVKSIILVALMEGSVVEPRAKIKSLREPEPILGIAAPAPFYSLQSLRN